MSTAKSGSTISTAANRRRNGVSLEMHKNFLNSKEIFKTCSPIHDHEFKIDHLLLNCRSIVNDNGEIKPRSLRFTWSMKTTSSRDPNEIMAEIKKVVI